MLAQAQASIPLCDQVRVLDNSSADDPFRPVMTTQGERVGIHQHPLPSLAVQMLNK
jgi:hypothetical protein